MFHFHLFFFSPKREKKNNRKEIIHNLFGYSTTDIRQNKQFIIYSIPLLFNSIHFLEDEFWKFSIFYIQSLKSIFLSNKHTMCAHVRFVDSCFWHLFKCIETRINGLNVKTDCHTYLFLHAAIILAQDWERGLFFLNIQCTAMKHGAVKWHDPDFC